MEYISASQINSYLLCPRKYRFWYIDGIPPSSKSSALAFGSSIHTALEWFHEELLAGKKPTAEDYGVTIRLDCRLMGLAAPPWSPAAGSSSDAPVHRL